MLRRFLLLAVCLLQISIAPAADSVVPYRDGNVARSVTELWQDVDFRADPLETEVVKEWREDGVVCRYVLFTVGTFKGREARCAALYTFPEGMQQGPAFVWAQGGGQRAERRRGRYFASRGFATIDINWGGRPVVDDIALNTDWGAVDPSQGPQFYAKALRPRVKLNLLPDEHTIDPVVSPRNGIWYLLAYAGRRAITFLEQQPEVDPQKIGFTGYSMGGNITSMVAIDNRLKAVVPMVGGSGFIMEDFPGLPDTGRSRGFQNIELYNRTVDAQAYWPHVRCPVLFLSASDDFHAVFDNVYRSAALIPHQQWRVSQLMHFNHGLGPAQWVLLNRWFNRYLKNKKPDVPRTPTTVLHMVANGRSAKFTVDPDNTKPPTRLNVYYSHDPNARTRFWKHAIAERGEASNTAPRESWTASVPVRAHLPLYVFANLTYPLDNPVETFQGTATEFTITSSLSVHQPPAVDVQQLRANAQHVAVFEDFQSTGLRNWATSPQGGISTYKFQDPDRAIPPADHSLVVTVQVPRERLSYRFRVTKRKFLPLENGPQATFFANRQPSPGHQKLKLTPADFTSRDGVPMKDWAAISTFRIDIYDGAARRTLTLNAQSVRQFISTMEWQPADSDS